MNINYNLKNIIFIILGIIIGVTLFILGNKDDSPGLSFIGIFLSFLIILKQILIHKKYYIPIVLIFLGFILTIFPLVLFLDKEINSYSINMFLINIIGISFIILAIKKIKKLKTY